VVCYFSGAKIVGNKIRNNQVIHAGTSNGGGIGGFHGSGEMWLVIENNHISENSCTAINNTASGGGIFVAGNAMIRNNKIIQNQCNCELLAADGGGVLAESVEGIPGSVFLINNTISFNTLTGEDRVRGGGVCILYSHAIVRNNRISHNSQTGNTANGCGILFRYAASTILTDNLISYNVANTGNIYVGTACLCALPYGPIQIENNEFSYNTGPMEVTTGTGIGLGILDAIDEPITINANIFMENSGKSGSGFYSRSCYNMVVSNNLFAGNEAWIGGAVGLYHPVLAKNTLNRKPGVDEMHPVFINNTFVENSATSQGGALYFNCLLNFPAIYNCIFYQNSSPSGNDISYVQGQEPITVSYSDLNTSGISGNWSGEGNIFEEPLFESSGPFAYALSPGSPCIDTGTPDTTGLQLPPADFLDHNRIWDGDGNSIATVDMGVCEFGAPVVGTGEISDPCYPSSAKIYPNPSNGIFTISIPSSKGNTSLLIFTITGRQLLERQINGIENQIDIRALPQGIYFIRVQNEKRVETGWMIKK